MATNSGDKPGSLDKLEFTDSGRPSSVLKSLYQSWRDGKYCDITITVGEQQVKVHKVVLISLSEYFKVLLDMDVEDSTNAVLHVDFDCLMLLLNYAYTGAVEVTVDNVQNLLIAADYLQVPFVKDSCEEFILKNVDRENCLTTLQFAQDFSLQKIKDRCFSLMGRHLEDVCLSEDFIRISHELVVELLNDNHLIVYRDNFPLPDCLIELAVLKAALQYISRQHEQLGKEEVGSLVTAARLAFVHNPELKNIVDGCSDELTKQTLQAVMHVLSEGSSTSDGFPPENVLQRWTQKREDRGSSLVLHHNAYADGRQVRPIVSKFNDITISGRISKISVVTRHWDGWVVVGGLNISVRDITDTLICHGLAKDAPQALGCFDVNLEETEVIVKVVVRSGWMINCLTFHTNKGRSFGPYGGDVGGNVHIAQPPPDKAGFLHSLKGAVVDNQGCLAVTCLTFNWQFGEPTDFWKPTEKLLGNWRVYSADQLITYSSSDESNFMNYDNIEDSDEEDDDSDFYN